MLTCDDSIPDPVKRMIDRCKPPVCLGYQYERAMVPWGFALWLNSLIKQSFSYVDPWPGPIGFARFVEDVVFFPLAVMGNPRVRGCDVRFIK